jgi:NAD(P)H dehydrogenase (quinone)
MLRIIIIGFQMLAMAMLLFAKQTSVSAVLLLSQGSKILWLAGKLVGKPVSFFTSTGTQGGGQETTIMTALTQTTHHGMIYIPPGYTAGAEMFSNEAARGGSPWGAGCLAGADGSRQPSELELSMAKSQGKYFAGTAKKLFADV